MKKKFARLILIILSLTFCTACNGSRGKVYEIYTNIPEDSFKVTSANYSVAHIIEGGVLPENVSASADTGDFSTKSGNYFSMDTQATLVVSDKFNSSEALNNYNLFSAEVDALLKNLENSLSCTIPTSCVSRFNSASAGETVEIDSTAYEVLTIAKNVYTLTEGYYNPAVYYSVYAYGFLGSYQLTTADALPDDAVIEKYAELSAHFGEIELYSLDGCYFAVKPDATVETDVGICSLKLDLGGIGKGYAVDKVNELFDKYGFGYGYFSFGTSSIAVKKHYKNAEYALSLTDPRSTEYGASYAEFKLSDSCLATSGDYEQYYEIGGVRYCHIIDPSTGRPVQTGIMTATVIGGTAAEDDALSTAIMAMGRDKAVKFVQNELFDRLVIFTYDAEK